MIAKGGKKGNGGGVNYGLRFQLFPASPAFLQNPAEIPSYQALQTHPPLARLCKIHRALPKSRTQNEHSSVSVPPQSPLLSRLFPGHLLPGHIRTEIRFHGNLSSGSVRCMDGAAWMKAVETDRTKYKKRTSDRRPLYLGSESRRRGGRPLIYFQRWDRSSRAECRARRFMIRRQSPRVRPP